jgi:hypothetical protein
MPTQERILVSYELVPTTMAGAFISPAPSADFDPNTATPRSLIENGFPRRRPDESGDPVLRGLAARFLSAMACRGPPYP